MAPISCDSVQHIKQQIIEISSSNVNHTPLTATREKCDAVRSIAVKRWIPFKARRNAREPVEG